MIRLDTVKPKEIKNYSIPGLTKLNSLVCGINENEVITIAARVGCGKTSFCLNMLSRFSRQGKCLLVSLEMGEYSIIERLGKSERKTKLENIIYTSVDTIEEIESIVKTEKVKFLFIDYLQLMNCSMQKVSRLIKQLTLKYNLITFQLSQLNRYAATSSPTMEMLSASDKIAHDSDQVWLITKDYINVVKNRKGKTGKIETEFIKDKFLFIESDKSIEVRNQVIEHCNTLMAKNDFAELEVYIDYLYQSNQIDLEFKTELVEWLKREKKRFYAQAGIWTIINTKLKF